MFACMCVFSEVGVSHVTEKSSSDSHTRAPSPRRLDPALLAVIHSEVNKFSQHKAKKKKLKKTPEKKTDVFQTTGDRGQFFP